VRGVKLFESVLGAGGARHEVLGDLALCADPGGGAG